MTLTMSVAKELGNKVGRAVKMAVIKIAVPIPSMSLSETVYRRKIGLLEGSRSENLCGALNKLYRVEME